MDNEIVFPQHLHPRAPPIYNRTNILDHGPCYERKDSKISTFRNDRGEVRVRVEDLAVARVRVGRFGWISPEPMPSLAGTSAEIAEVKGWRSRFTSIRGQVCPLVEWLGFRAKIIRSIVNSRARTRLSERSSRAKSLQKMLGPR